MSTAEYPQSSKRESVPDRLQRYRRIRGHSDRLCETLQPEDCMLQSMPDASPVRWHLAHTTWFFETFLLKRQPDYTPVHPQFEALFNSYYNAVGEPLPRHQRGLLSRPTVSEVFEYRRLVDDRMETLLETTKDDSAVDALLDIGLNHEQQHQELMLTDLKHAFSHNPLAPVYRDDDTDHDASESLHPSPGWVEYPNAEVVDIGNGGRSFCFDNELPRHRALVQPFALSTELVTNGEYLEFIKDGGYTKPHWWLSAGWSMVTELGWQAPLYWRQIDGVWHHYTLHGLRPVDPHAPLCHISYFEADAFARFRGCRLPSEHQWEHAVVRDGASLHLQNDSPDHRSVQCHPRHRFETGVNLRSVFGCVWQWTCSDYNAYPGYRPAEGAIGEYNGKFMSGNYVLRGGSCATPPGHSRVTYRNFFSPSTRWQFAGIRLARDLN